MTREQIKEVQRTTDINYSPYYDILPNLINERGYESGLTIGIFAGGHEKSILDKTKIKLLVGIDPYLEYKQNQIGMGTINTQEEFDIMCDLATYRLNSERFHFLRMTSDKAIKQLRFFEFDFIFVDGLHEPDQLQRDIDNYVPLVRRGGVIAFHDYKHPLFPELTQVIDNFVKKYNTKLIICPMYFVYIDKTW